MDTLELAFDQLTMDYDYDKELWPKFRQEELELIFCDEEEGGTGGGILFDSRQDKKQRRKKERMEKKQAQKNKKLAKQQSKKQNKVFDEDLGLGVAAASGDFPQVSTSVPHSPIASSHSHSGVFPSEFEAEQQRENARHKQKKWKTLGRSMSKLWKKVVVEEENQEQERLRKRELGFDVPPLAQEEQQIQTAVALGLNDKLQQGEQFMRSESSVPTYGNHYMMGESIIDRIEPQQQYLQQYPLATQPTYYHLSPSAPEACHFYPQPAVYQMSPSVPCPGRTLVY